MSETFEKIDGETLKIISVEETEQNRTLEQLESELQRAKDSLASIQADNALREADAQATIDLLQTRLDEAVKLGIK